MDQHIIKIMHVRFGTASTITRMKIAGFPLGMDVGYWTIGLTMVRAMDLANW